MARTARSLATEGFFPTREALSLATVGFFFNEVITETVTMRVWLALSSYTLNVVKATPLPLELDVNEPRVGVFFK